MQRRTTPRRGSGATLGGRLGRDGVHEDTTESSWWFYGGYTRRIYGRQAEAHQFPIQFADLALPILGDSRERGGIIPSAREMAFPPRGRIDESFPRLNIEDPSRTASLFFDRCLLRRKKGEGGGILRETSGVESFSYSRNVIFRWNLWERALYSGMKALFEF